MEQDKLHEGRCVLPSLHPFKPSIRLLKVSKLESQSSSLSFDIESFVLLECPSYKAFSYTWGSPFPSGQALNPVKERFPSDEEFATRNVDWQVENETIRCNGQLVQVGLNLFEALTQLSMVCEEGYLWIDRLCIDQTNTEERSSQVTIMSQIYSKASSVLVWLGRGGEDASAAMQIQDNFAGPIFDLYTAGKLTEAEFQTHSPNDSSYLAEYNLQITMPKVWFAWHQFFRRSWFYRRWTLQEAALA
jgi:hypothetical protein